MSFGASSWWGPFNPDLHHGLHVWPGVTDPVHLEPLPFPRGWLILAQALKMPHSLPKGIFTNMPGPAGDDPATLLYMLPAAPLPSPTSLLSALPGHADHDKIRAISKALLCFNRVSSGLVTSTLPLLGPPLLYGTTVFASRISQRSAGLVPLGFLLF